MTSQGVLLRRPLPPNLPSADADGCKYNAKPVVAPKQKVKSDDDGQIGNGSVSQRFDLLQRMKQSEQELMNLFKPRGPDAFPKREPRKEALSTLAKYYEDCNTKPAPNLPDFVCATDERFCDTLVPPIAKPVISICTWDKAPQSKYGGVSAVDQQVMNGVYVGETAPLPDVQPRKPWRQVLIESQAQMSEAPVSYDYTKALAPYYHCEQADIEQSELELVSKLMQNHPDLYLLVRGEALSGAPPAFRESPLLALHDGDALQDGEVFQFGTCDASEAERKRDHPNKACEDASLAEDSEVLALAGLSIRGPVSALDDPNVADQSGGCWDRDEAHAKEIVSADAAILNCLTHGGARLNLKAHFLGTIPDLPPTFAFTLTHVNLSFNELLEIPVQLFEARQLQNLCLRSNPISVIPEGLSSCTKLRSLNMAFCVISVLPQSLFTLTELELLDFSYNNIDSVPPAIGSLRQLKEFCVNGNRIGAFPREMLSLDLNVLRCSNNFTNSLFWRSTAPPQVQSLLIASATVLSQSIDDCKVTSTLPEELRNLLSCALACDYCGKCMPGGGLLVIKPAAKLFDIRLLPILFHVCSQSCRKLLRRAVQLNSLCL